MSATLIAVATDTSPVWASIGSAAYSCTHGNGLRPTGAGSCCRPAAPHPVDDAQPPHSGLPLQTPIAAALVDRSFRSDAPRHP